MSVRSARIGIDVGGTFTDATLIDGATGRLFSAKAFTTPRDRSQGVIDAIRAVLADSGIAAEQVAEIVHGSTTGTNALIERTGARTGLLTTAGFRDVLEIGRVMRPAEGLYDMAVDRPPPLVPRRLCLEARERVGPRGEVLVALDEASVEEACEIFARHQVEAVAICFLFAFLNPEHERRAAAIVARRLPGAAISLSHLINPEYREYERASTTVMNAYLTPVMNAYLDRLEPRIDEVASGAKLYIIQANGGATTVGERAQPRRCNRQFRAGRRRRGRRLVRPHARARPHRLGRHGRHQLRHRAHRARRFAGDDRRQLCSRAFTVNISVSSDALPGLPAAVPASVDCALRSSTKFRR